MQTLTDQIVTIEEKVKQLAMKLERAQKDNEGLLAENKKLKTAIQEKNTQVQNLETNKVIVSPEDKKQQKNTKKLKKEIEQHIKEIDKCLEWLQNS